MTNKTLTGVVQEVNYETNKVLIAQKWHDVVGRAPDYLNRITKDSMVEFAMNPSGGITYIVPFKEKPKSPMPGEPLSTRLLAQENVDVQKSIDFASALSAGLKLSDAERMKVRTDLFVQLQRNKNTENISRRG